MKYLVVIEKGPSSFGAYVPDLPGCVAVAMNRSVCVDRSTGQKQPLTESVAARLREIGRID